MECLVFARTDGTNTSCEALIGSRIFGALQSKDARSAVHLVGWSWRVGRIQRTAPACVAHASRAHVAVTSKRSFSRWTLNDLCESYTMHIYNKILLRT